MLSENKRYNSLTYNLKKPRKRSNLINFRYEWRIEYNVSRVRGLLLNWERMIRVEYIPNAAPISHGSQKKNAFNNINIFGRHEVINNT